MEQNRMSIDDLGSFLRGLSSLVMNVLRDELIRDMRGRPDDPDNLI